MPLDGQCPECNGFLKPNARKCSCGWALKPLGKTGSTPFDPDHFRCEWRSGSERCHYAGTSSADTHGSGPWYCSGHFRCDEPIVGHAIVEESRQVHAADYTAESMLKAARSSYLKRPIPPRQPWHAVALGDRTFRSLGAVTRLRERQPGEEG